MYKSLLETLGGRGRRREGGKKTNSASSQAKVALQGGKAAQAPGLFKTYKAGKKGRKGSSLGLLFAFFFFPCLAN